MKKSIVTAVLIAVTLVIWLATGQISQRHPQVAEDGGPATAAARNELRQNQQAFAVRVRRSYAQPYARDLIIRGKTAAIRKVELKAQTDGRVAQVLVEKGARVEAGAIICQLAVAERAANLAEAEALLRQRQLEFNATTQLAAQGHRSETAVAAAAALFDAAKAQTAQMQVELDYTQIRAPFRALVNERPAETGDYLQKGDICALLVDEDPFLVVGEISEREVGFLATGAHGRARLADGRTIDGTIRYVSGAAREQTRTFRVELEIPNPDHDLRDGMTADILLDLPSSPAHLLSPAVLVLGPRGQLGVRTVDDFGKVRFLAAEILGESTAGVWLGKLPLELSIIVLGQEFVTEGQGVRVQIVNVGQSS